MLSPDRAFANLSPRHALLIGPIKGEPRLQVKIQNARNENNDTSKWMFSGRMGDMLRAHLVGIDGEAVLEAWTRCCSRFDITEEHGFLNNSFNTSAHRPPFILTNVHLDMPDHALTAVGEIQIHLLAVFNLKVRA